jgi:hypothetical protein
VLAALVVIYADDFADLSKHIKYLFTSTYPSHWAIAGQEVADLIAGLAGGLAIKHRDGANFFCENRCQTRLLA